VDLTVFAWISIALACLCAVVILVDEVRRPQAMAVMNAVWPLTALYFSVFALWAYFRHAQRHTGRAMERHPHGQPAHERPERKHAPSLSEVALGTSHCGAGCALADLFTEFGIAASGIVLFGSSLWTSYVLDLVVAWLAGIAFQYFALRPMRQDLGTGGAIRAAIQADTASILAFQAGMYLWMALVHTRLFPGPHHLTPFDPRYWLMMQIAMICGFATSFPMNRWLLARGVKEAM
jgi:hypothetical protein